MAHIMPPEPRPMREDHPDKPVMDDDEDYVEYICRTATHWTDNPPEPPEGFELIPCGAQPRHWPEYSPVDSDLYPAECGRCQYDALRQDRARLDCRLNHRRWKSWKWLGKVDLWAYSMGITAGGGVTLGGCEHCGIGRQQHRPKWRGRRVYCLGVMVDRWRCMLRYHHMPTEDPGIGIPCTKCLPCADCGSTSVGHRDCGAIA